MQHHQREIQYPVASSRTGRSHESSTAVAVAEESFVLLPSSSARPLINGKPVAFHINDLKGLSSCNFRNPQRQPVVNEKQYDSDLMLSSTWTSVSFTRSFYRHRLLHSSTLINSNGAAAANRHKNNNKQLIPFVSHSPTETWSTFTYVPDYKSFYRPLLPATRRTFSQPPCPFTPIPSWTKLDPAGTMRRWFRDSCTYDPLAEAYVKNLHQLSATRDRLHRVVLVDNNPLSFLANPSNGILVNSFLHGCCR